jgi:hypothetical protein
MVLIGIKHALDAAVQCPHDADAGEHALPDCDLLSVRNVIQTLSAKDWVGRSAHIFAISDNMRSGLTIS